MRPREHNVYFYRRQVVTQSCVTLRSYGLQPTRVLFPWNSPGKKTGVCCHSLLQGIFPTQGLNLGLLHCGQMILYCLSHQAPIGGREMPKTNLRKHLSYANKSLLDYATKVIFEQSCLMVVNKYVTIHREAYGKDLVMFLFPHMPQGQMSARYQKILYYLLLPTELSTILAITHNAFLYLLSIC